MSGTARLAPSGADELGIIGTGKQSIPQIAAVNAVRPLKSVRVASRDRDRREAFAEEAADRLGIPVKPAASVSEAVADAPIVTLVTNSTEAFLSAGMLARGSHLNAMGAIVPARIEFFDDIFDRVDVVVVDTLQGTRDLSAEFRHHYGTGDWSQVQTISSLIAADQTRPASADLTLFKAVGMGLSDLALAIEVLARAYRQNKGHEVPQRVKLPPRLTG